MKNKNYKIIARKERIEDIVRTTITLIRYRKLISVKQLCKISFESSVDLDGYNIEREMNRKDAFENFNLITKRVKKSKGFKRYKKGEKQCKK